MNPSGLSTARGVSPPADAATLLARARALAGYTLGELAARHGLDAPRDQRRRKGVVGEFIETLLGASAGARPEPDFPHLGIELKTIPLGNNGRPRESTHICTVPLSAAARTRWEDSLVRQKLAHVLWVPIDCRADQLPDRVVGRALLWRPTPDQLARIRADWEEIMELVATGRADQVDARMGECLQLRPKAANASALAPASNDAGEPAATLPRGFYLRASFTAAILAAAGTA